MAKIKTHKASQKRFSVTAKGKVKMNHKNRRHKLGHKTPKRKRQLRRNAYVSDAFADNIKAMIPYVK